MPYYGSMAVVTPSSRLVAPTVTLWASVAYIAVKIALGMTWCAKRAASSIISYYPYTE